MIVASPEDTPFTIVCSKLFVVVATLVLIIVEVADEPPRFEVKVLPTEDRVFEVFKLVTVKLVAVALVIVALVVINPDRVNLSFSSYVTSPLVVVDTTRLELVEEAKKVYRLAIEVVAVTPLITVVTTPFAAFTVLLLIILVEEDNPLTIEVMVLPVEDRD
jgi:hypothetical protein